jgi:hypothetical protein
MTIEFKTVILKDGGLMTGEYEIPVEVIAEVYEEDGYVSDLTVTNLNNNCVLILTDDEEDRIIEEVVSKFDSLCQKKREAKERAEDARVDAAMLERKEKRASKKMAKISKVS